ncbi:MAG: ParA family protein [Myxococcaceae bacterium]
MKKNSIAVISQKGGVGKTTVALNLAVAFAEKKKRTLLIDTDPQGGVGLSLARGDTSMVGLAEVLAGAATLDQGVLATRHEHLLLFPRGRLDPIDVITFEQAIHEKGKFAGLLATLRPRFDEIIIDTPAGLGLVTRAVLSAADFALLPVQAEPVGLRSIQQALRVIEHVRGHENRSLALLGVLLTMVELKKESSREVAEALWSGFAGVLETMIPRADVFTSASRKGLPLAFLGGAVSPEARRFEWLANELENVMAALEGPHGQTETRAERQLF